MQAAEKKGEIEETTRQHEHAQRGLALAMAELANLQQAYDDKSRDLSRQISSLEREVREKVAEMQRVEQDFEARILSAQSKFDTERNRMESILLQGERDLENMQRRVENEKREMAYLEAQKKQALAKLNQEILQAQKHLDVIRSQTNDVLAENNRALERLSQTTLEVFNIDHYHHSSLPSLGFLCKEGN